MPENPAQFQPIKPDGQPPEKGFDSLGGIGDFKCIGLLIVQFFLIWFGLFLVSILGIVEFGGFDEVFQRLPENMSALWSTAGSAGENPMGITWIGLVLGLGFVLSFGYWTTDFLIVQRAFSAKDLRAARMTPIVASFFKMFLPFIVVVAGLVAWKLTEDGQMTLMIKENGEPDFNSALPLLLARYFPPGLMGLGITALLAGFMAGQAGNISAFNTVWTYDLYRVLIKKDASDEHLVWVGRVTTIVGILLSVGTAYWAMQFPTIMDYIQAIFSWVNAPLFATMLLGMFWKRTTSAGAFWGLLAGMATSFSIYLGFRFGWLAEAARYITFAENPSDMSQNLWQAWWAWVVCFVLTIVISLFTSPKEEKDLVGLVKGLTEKTVDKDVPLLARPGFWAAISAAIVVGLNVYFW